MYVSGRVDKFDMVDIDLFTVVALNMMVLKLGDTFKSEPMFYNYLKPLTSLDEGLYALACEEDVRCLDSYLRALRFKMTLEKITDEDGSIAANKNEKMLLLTWHESSETTKEPVCEFVTPNSLPQHDSSTHYVGRTHEPILSEVNTQEPIVAEVNDEVPIVEEVRTQEFSVEDVVVEDYVSSGEDEEDAEHVLLMDNEENEIVEPDVDVYFFGISMDLPFDNIGITNLVPNDVLEGEDVDVINEDGFDSDPGNDEEKSYRKRRLAELRTEMEEAKDKVYLHSIESRRNLKLYKNDGVRIRARCDGKVLVFTMSQGTGPTGLNRGMEAGPSKSSGPTTRSKKGRIQLQRELEVQISMSKAFIVKAKTEREIRGGHVLQYSVLRDYVVELQSTNPNTTVKIAVERNTDHSFPTRVFQRIYICLGALKLSFRAIRSVRLRWYFHEGAISRPSIAIKTVYPSVEHKYRLRHIHESIKQRWCGQAYKDLLWRVASATNVRDFKKCLLELKMTNLKVREWLNKIPAEHWARSYSSGRAKFDLFLNNICEVFNGKIIGACWNMALNDRTTPPPETWVNPCYWLSTWKETYSHKIQPICGTKYLEKSTCPTTLLPPKHHVQVGRPRKKRKKSKHEDEPFVKDGKLSRKERTITCQSCGNTGHNKATCKGQGRKATTGAGAVIVLSATTGEGGVGVSSQGSSRSRWTKRRMEEKMGDLVPAQSSAAGGGLSGGDLRDYVKVVGGTDDGGGEKNSNGKDPCLRLTLLLVTNVIKGTVSQKNACEENVTLNNSIGKQIGDFVDMHSEAVEQKMVANVPDEIDDAKGEQVPTHVVKKGNLEFLVCEEVANPGVNELVDKGRLLKRKRVYA
nr:hypothetical protein [Tanacetum cinerariifolium]